MEQWEESYPNLVEIIDCIGEVDGVQSSLNSGSDIISLSCSYLYEICVIHEKRGDHTKANGTFHILSAKLRDIKISEFYNDKNGKESIQLDKSLMKYKLVEKNVMLFDDVVKIVGKVIQRYD